MPTLPIESVIDQLSQIAVPSSGENLLGFAMDADHALFGCKQLTGARLDMVRGTGDPRCLIEIEATVAPDVNSIQELHQGLRDLWAKLCYRDFQSSSCTWYREAMVLRFATYMASGHLFVTGRIVASGGPYPNLVERYERDFKANGPLPVMPLDE